MKNEICGCCTHFYCDKCTKTNKDTNALKKKCNKFVTFNAEEYRKNVRK